MGIRAQEQDGVVQANDLIRVSHYGPSRHPQEPRGPPGARATPPGFLEPVEEARAHEVQRVSKASTAESSGSISMGRLALVGAGSASW